MSELKSPYVLYDDLIKSGEIVSDPDQSAAIEVLDDCYKHLMKDRKKGFFSRFQKEDDLEPHGVYMHGGVGRGKSMLMDLFYSAFPDSDRIRRVHFHEFMIELHEYIHQKRQEYKKKGGQSPDRIAERFVLDHCKDLTVLCFDEFHVTDVADAMLLGKLFETFIKQDVFIVCTSNWIPDRLYEDGLQRERFLPVIKMIKDNWAVLPLVGDVDYRMQAVMEQGVYFYPLGIRADKKAEELFETLTDNQVPLGEALTIKGRQLTVRQVAKNIARFSFQELCEQPLGAEDYLTVAKRYDAIFLEGIPRLGYDRRNETKRLMTLIDALYDQGVKLFITADAEPAKLYTGHDYEFEFERTVSRLIEMQGKDYLKKGDVL